MTQLSSRKPPRRAIPSEKKTSFEKTLELLSKFPLVLLWNVALLLGGLLLLSHFMNIGFLPDFDLQSILGVLAASFFVGMILVLALGGSMLFPLLFLNQSTAKEQLRIVFIDSFLGIFTFSTTLSFSLLVEEERVFLGENLLIFIFSVICSLALLNLQVKYSKNTKYDFSSLLRIGGWTVWSLLPFILVFIFYQGEKDFTYKVLALMGLQLFYATLCIAIINIEQTEFRLAVGFIAPFISAIALMLATSNMSLITDANVKILGLSSGKDVVSIVLKKEGCIAANLTAKQAVCELSNNELGLLNNAQIVSRVGLQAVIQLNSAETIQTTLSTAKTRIVLQKDQIVSWTKSIKQK